MNRLTDHQLLREYAERRSEAAFAELVRRHIDLIHSAALRWFAIPTWPIEALQPMMSDQDWISYKDRWRAFGKEPPCAGW